MDFKHARHNPSLASVQSADRLDSWKEIAAHLKRDIRTAQRWEAIEGLPVYRHRHGQHDSVYAYKSEIDHWWANRRPPSASPQKQEDPPHAEVRIQASLLGYFRFLAYTVVVAVVVLAAGEARHLFLKYFAPRPASATSTLPITVLPFTNLSSGLDANLAEGMTYDIISDLSKSRTLRVIGRASAMHFEGSHEPVSRIAQQLHSDKVVRGTIARADGRIRIAVQLLDAPTGRVLWTRQFDRDDSDPLSVQADVSRVIATSIGGTLSPDSPPVIPSALSSSPEARLDYLTARDFWNRRDPAAIHQAIEHFTRAIREDPKYAPAYAGLSDSYILSSAWDSVSPTAVLSKAKKTAITAVELNPSLAEAHASLAVVAYRHDWDFQTADREFQEAITLNPSYSRAHQWYGVFLTYMGRFDQAFAQLKQAQSLDPFSPIVQSDIAVAYYLNHQNQEALTRFHAILEANPDFIPALTNLGCIFAASGKYPEARVEFERVAALSGNKSYLEELAPLVSVASGNRSQSRKQIEDILRNWKPNEDADARVAFLYSEMNDKENALRYLGMAYRNRSWSLVLIKVDPTFDFLRSDPRFQSLEKQIGLIPNASSEHPASSN
ncbi:MAG: TPR end-of-group domain-containing protein [Candidatus Acidiferrales bacterium]